MSCIAKCMTWVRVMTGSGWAWSRRFQHARNVLAATAVVTALTGAGEKILGTNTTETVLGWVVGFGIIIAAVAGFLPVRTIVRQKVKTDEEVTIEVIVGDILDKKTSRNAIIVPTNVEGECVLEEMDAQKGKIRMSSVQGQYTRWMESQGKGSEIYSTMEEWRRKFVEGRSAEAVDDNRGKIISLGQKQEHRAYWIVLGRLLSAGERLITETEYLEGLSKSWDELGKVSGREDLLTPVIGAGQMKLPRRTTGLVTDMVHTFIDAQSKIRTCKRLTIVIRPEDLKGVKLTEMSEAVTLECRRYRRTERARQVSEAEKGTVLNSNQ